MPTKEIILALSFAQPVPRTLLSEERMASVPFIYRPFYIGRSTENSSKASPMQPEEAALTFMPASPVRQSFLARVPILKQLKVKRNNSVIRSTEVDLASARRVTVRVQLNS